MKPLAVRPLDAGAFAPYGAVIETDGASHYPVNAGAAERFHDLAPVVTDAGGRAGVSIFRAQPVAAPVAIAMVERHPLGSQAFMPLDNHPWLVVVAPADPGGMPGTPLAFLASGRQGVSYAPGTWHHPLLALHATDFLVVDRIGPGDNLEEHVWPDGGWSIPALP